MSLLTDVYLEMSYLQQYRRRVYDSLKLVNLTNVPNGMNLINKVRADPVQSLIYVVGIPLSMWFLIGSPGADTQLGLSVALVWFGIGASLILFKRIRS